MSTDPRILAQPSLPTDRSQIQKTKDGTGGTTGMLRASEDFKSFDSEDRWWKGPKYTNSNFFEFNPEIYRRTDPTPESIPEITDQLRHYRDVRYAHYIERAAEGNKIPPSDIKPIGRIGDKLRRDEAYYSEAKAAIEKTDLSNTFVVNYTGHQASVATALAEAGVGSNWRLSANERVWESLQDWNERLRPNQRN